jgi:hypothetical protein
LVLLHHPEKPVGTFLKDSVPQCQAISPVLFVCRHNSHGITIARRNLSAESRSDVEMTSKISTHCFLGDLGLWGFADHFCNELKPPFRFAALAGIAEQKR